MSLTCPKCRGEMHAYERNGVTIDQCGDCRGVFLDRGELERLVDAESAWKAAPAPSAAAPQQYGYHGKPYQKKRKSFLSELFDD
jgi:Zn-finger nucleic acid-binding protein